MRKADELGKNSPGPPLDVDQLDDKSQTLSNAEQLQDAPSSLGSSAVDKGPSPESLHQFEMGKADELGETFGPPSDVDQKSQASSSC